MLHLSTHVESHDCQNLVSCLAVVASLATLPMTSDWNNTFNNCLFKVIYLTFLKFIDIIMFYRDMFPFLLLNLMNSCILEELFFPMFIHMKVRYTIKFPHLA